MNNFSKLGFIVFSALSLLSATAGAHPAGGPTRRGAVEISGPAVKLVTVGPAQLHGYSAFAGGALFVAPAVTGTDADCAAAVTTARPVRLVADRMSAVAIAKGEVACLLTSTARSFELLWHTK